MRKILLAIVLSLFLLMPIWATQATAFDKYGVSFSGSLGIMSGKLGDNCHKFDWGSVGVFGRNNLTPTFYVDFELDVGNLKWCSDKKWAIITAKNHGHSKCHKPTTTTEYFNSGGGYVTSLETRAMFMQDEGWYHSGIGFGLALLGDGDIYHLAKDAVYGLITVRLRVPINDRFGVDFEADHISAIGRHDQGMNVWKFGLYHMF